MQNNCARPILCIKTASVLLLFFAVLIIFKSLLSIPGLEISYFDIIITLIYCLIMLMIFSQIYISFEIKLSMYLSLYFLKIGLKLISTDSLVLFCLQYLLHEIGKVIL